MLRLDIAYYVSEAAQPLYRRILRWREIANLWRASAGPMVLAELVIGSLRRAAGWRRRLQNIGHKPEWVAAVPTWRMRYSQILEFEASYGPRFCNRRNREIIELDPERVFEVIADLVRSIAEGGRYSAEDVSSAIDELLQELDRHQRR